MFTIRNPPTAVRPRRREVPATVITLKKLVDWCLHDPRGRAAYVLWREAFDARCTLPLGDYYTVYCYDSPDSFSSAPGTHTENTYLVPYTLFRSIPGSPFRSSDNVHILTSRFLLSMELGFPLDENDNVDHRCWYHRCQNVEHMSRSSAERNRSRDACRDSFIAYLLSGNAADLRPCPHTPDFCIPVELARRALRQRGGRR